MATVGLKFDLSAWKKGIRDAGALVKKGINKRLLTPFDKAVKKTAAGIKIAFGAMGKFIKAVLASAFAPLIALFAVGAAINAIKNALTGSLAAYRDYDDSVTTLQASLRTLGEGVDIAKATESAKELGDQLRVTMGIAGAETNRALSTMLTRGFTGPQARQLTILAANYAKKTGKPLEDVTKKIADAANGSAEAIKDLGVQITPTGDRIRDAEAAVLALKASYGDIGADLANPSERLSAAWGELAVSLGEKISPIIEPIVEGFADFVSGLTQTEEGEAMLNAISETLAGIVDWTGRIIVGVNNLVTMVKSGGGVIFNFINEMFNTLMANVLDGLRDLPGGDWLLKQMGFDPEFAGQAFKQGAAEAARNMAGSLSEFEKAQQSFLNGSAAEGSILGGLGQIQEAGKKAREEAAAALSAEINATRGMGFAGRGAMRPEGSGGTGLRDGAASAGRQQVGGGRGGSVDGRGGARFEEGQRLVANIKLVHTRQDRFRKARMA